MEPVEYRKLAALEDEMWYFRALHTHIEHALTGRVPADACVIDAGCGTGGLIRRLAPRHPAWRWTGVDLDPLACALARERVSGVGAGAVKPVRIEQGAVAALPAADETVDAVVSADVLYHVDDDLAALREARRVLRRGGVIVVNVPAYRWLWSYHDVAVHSRRRYTRGELLTRFAAAGLRPVHATYWNSIPFPLIVARRKLLPAPAGGSDVQSFPKPVERAFDAAMAAERGWIRVFGRIPFGTSVFAVARRD
jgi:SAM-dependent methyltransferase